MNLHESIQQNSISYLCFAVGDEKFALHVANVTSILEMQQITTVPNCPVYMRGIINLRGTVLPVLELRTLLGMNANQITANSCILVLDLVQNGENTHVGMLVDSVTEVFELQPQDILTPPSLSNSTSIIGIAKRPDGFVMLLEAANLIESHNTILSGIAS